jgi:hypothetical protein
LLVLDPPDGIKHDNGYGNNPDSQVAQPHHQDPSECEKYESDDDTGYYWCHFNFWHIYTYQKSILSEIAGMDSEKN